MEYKETLNLPQTTLEMRANATNKEPQTQKFWEDIKVYDKNLYEDLQFWEKSVFQIAKFIVLCLILCVTLLCAYQLCFTSSSNEMPEVQHYIQEAIIEEQEVESQDTTIQKKDTRKISFS